MTNENSAHLDLPFTEFMSTVRTCMNVTVVFLVLITFLTVGIYSRMRQNENTQILAILTSVGATVKQKHRLIWTELFLLYFPLIIVGTIFGCIPGIQIGRHFLKAANKHVEIDLLLVILVILILIFAGVLLTILCNLISKISFKKGSVIQNVTKQNIKAADERHIYRQSQTFKNQSLYKRLARKSVDYYSKIYNIIALSFTISALYPILAALLFWYVLKADVVLDINPYDGFDTSVAVLAVVNQLLYFLAGCFLILTLLGILSAVFIIRMQILTRKQSLIIYSSIGILDTNIKKVIKYEFETVFVKSFVCLLFVTVIVNACFSLSVGL